MSHSPPSEPDYPYPPRFRALKRWSVIGSLVIIALVGLRIWWGRECQRRFDALVTDAHSHGRRILINDFAFSPVPDERNAAAVLRTAANALNKNKSKELDEWDFGGELPLNTTDVRMIQELLRTHGDDLGQARGARDLKQVDWGVRLRTPAMNVLLPFLSEIRHLSSTEQAVALYQHTRGNDRETMEGVRDILFQARALEAEPTFLVSHLVSISVQSLGSRLVLQTAPDLAVVNSSRSSNGPATRQQVLAVMGELLDESSILRGASQGWDGERMGMLDNIPFFARQQLQEPLWTIFRPMFLLDGVRAARDAGEATRMFDEPDYVKASRYPQSFRTGKYPVVLLSTRVMSQFLAVGPSKTLLQRHWSLIAERRAAAIALGLRLYALDHEGRLPARLEDLVPEYMPALPADPFTEGRPFCYRPDSPAPMLYSVGINGFDDNGDGSQKPGTANPPDIVFSLAPRPRVTTAPAAAPTDQ